MWWNNIHVYSFNVPLRYTYSFIFLPVLFLFKPVENFSTLLIYFFAMVRKSTHGGIKKIALWFCMLVALMKKFLSFLIEIFLLLIWKNFKKKGLEEFIVRNFIDFSLFMKNIVIVMMMIGVLMWWLLSPHKTTTNSINFFWMVPNSTNYSLTHFFYFPDGYWGGYLYEKSCFVFSFFSFIVFFLFFQLTCNISKWLADEIIPMP